MENMQKASPETITMLEAQAKLLTSPELEALQNKINGLIEERDRVWMAQQMSREQLLDLYRSRGYDPKPGDKFWKIRSPTKGRGFYGWQVGQYEHSCHIDTTDILVLFIIEPGHHGSSYVMDYAEMWLDGPIVV